ncbi:lysozyme inhibitor LprI family protein [Kosakonia sacchari]|uniref:lysozyme inhibitor LprI family protein n=1 Tax=Kosakonia sacchari TaxID=1158459 RepID=UPI0025B1C012|nr:lysozyme inhibitor LprI family protein [Kosakonia sacchari]MDN2486468.1 lysozyme inhibitor LprI family protein [Kosakonia sacchari]
MTGSIIRFTPARVKWVALAALVSLSYCAAYAAETPASILGAWRIISAEPDHQATARVSTIPGDPRYVGRVIHLDGNSAYGELIWDVDCQQPTYTPQSLMTLDEAILKTSGERYVEPKTPVAKDFGFEQPGNLKITPILIQCKSGYLSTDGVSIKNWVALLSDDSAVMNWFDNSYVVMQRVKSGEKAKPSFSCDAKLNAIEQTICSSDDLSSWDRSVTDAYTIQLQQQQEIDPADKAALAGMKAAQRDWLKKRNQCQTDEACLTKSMQQRTFELVSKIQ